jgi:serine/threonine-protein kinase
MTDLREELASSLESTYRLERELGGGGMSRVFQADDVALGRSVVIKVLHPELAAGVNAERFKREVQLAARLQHPHIVPVLTSGEVNGLPYYVMPFVKGESLQARIARGPLSIAEVVNIVADVAKALAYAHADGVVHRDIKPDNILLSGNAAAVADFGIAKAISSSRREDAGLTSVGTSLGTAGYMAPEQVAGDPSLDHRADIYALGCVAYEMLTGSAPFAGKSAQQMLAAHVLETPAPVRERRPDTPPVLADLVMRCIAKDPAQRPANGEAILASLDDIAVGATQPQAPPRVGARRGTWIATAAALVVIAAGTFALWHRGAAPAFTGTTLAVAPFEVLDPQLALWKEGLVDVLSRNLDGAASIRILSPGAAIKQWQGRVGRDEAAAFAKRTGAQLVVYGALQPAGRDIVDAKVWLLDARQSSPPVEVQARDSSSRMDRVSDSLSVKLLAALGDRRGGGAARSLGSGSLAAVKAFLQGAQYFRKTRFDSAAAAFRQATALDTNFAIAHAYLNQALGWTGGSADERAALAQAALRHLRPGLSPLDSLTVVAIAHYYDPTGNTVANQRQGFEAARLAAERYPSDAFAGYMAADFRYHADPHLPDAEALRLFDRAIAADSDFAPSYIHAVEISARDGAAALRRYTQAYLARDPADREARGLQLAMQLAGPGGTADAALGAVIDTAAPNVVNAASTALMRLVDSAETGVYLMTRAAKRPDAASAGGAGFEAAWAQQLAMRGHVPEAWRHAMAAKSFGAAELAFLGLVPPDSAKQLASWLGLQSDASLAAVPAMAAAHDTTAMRAAIAGLERAGASLPPNATARRRAGTQYFLAEARAYYALAKGDTAAATTAFEALSDSLFNVPLDQFVRARLVERNDPKRALGMLESQHFSPGLVAVARELEIGRLAEKANDPRRAVEAYAYVANAWAHTDSGQLRNAVRESRDALARLDADGKLRAQLAPR